MDLIQKLALIYKSARMEAVSDDLKRILDSTAYNRYCAIGGLLTSTSDYYEVKQILQEAK